MRLRSNAAMTGLFLSVGLLLIIWFSRLVSIDTFPPFIDETIHIHGGETARSMSLFYDGQIGRQGTFWWLMLFQAYRGSPIWIARVVTALALLPGIAALMGTARLVGGYWSAVLFGTFFLFSSYHMFFGRLALADPIAGSAVLVAIYFSSRLRQRRHWLDALATGAFLAVGFVAKVNIVPFVGVPVAAAFCLHPHKKIEIRAQAWWLAAALGASLVLIGGFVLGMRLVGQDVLTRSFFLALSGEVTVANRSLIDIKRIITNIQWTVELIGTYLGTPVTILLIIALVIQGIRRQFFVILCIIGPMAAIWLSITQESRFLIVPIALLLLAGAIELGRLRLGAMRVTRTVIVVLMIGWGAMQWMPFAVTAANDPEQLPLPAVDVQQYLRSSAAGTSYPETIRFLQAYPVKAVIGLMMNCQGFRYLALNQQQPYPVDCPTVNLDGSSVVDLSNIVREKQAENVFVLLEKVDYVPQDIPGKLVTVIDRPFDGPKTYIYQLSAP